MTKDQAGDPLPTHLSSQLRLSSPPEEGEGGRREEREGRALKVCLVLLSYLKTTVGSLAEVKVQMSSPSKVEDTTSLFSVGKHTIIIIIIIIIIRAGTVRSQRNMLCQEM
ncbi:hypothetical protein INR49_027858 [Caranx melampygus]|nr:hypothetical protein INR49_027858 [Caranx melampygus]